MYVESNILIRLKQTGDRWWRHQTIEQQRDAEGNPLVITLPHGFHPIFPPNTGPISIIITFMTY